MFSSSSPIHVTFLFCKYNEATTYSYINNSDHIMTFKSNVSVLPHDMKCPIPYKMKLRSTKLIRVQTGGKESVHAWICLDNPFHIYTLVAAAISQNLYIFFYLFHSVRLLRAAQCYLLLSWRTHAGAYRVFEIKFCGIRKTWPPSLLGIFRGWYGGVLNAIGHGIPIAIQMTS